MRRIALTLIILAAIIAAAGLVVRWLRSDGPSLTHADVEGIASATVRGTKIGATADCSSDYRDNGVWIVHCDTEWVAPVCEKAYTQGNTLADGCMKQARYLVLVSDETGKVIDYSP